MPNENVFVPTENNEANKPDLEAITADTLVGEGQKYADANQLAKAYVSADYTLEQQKQKIADLEARSKVLNDLLEQNKSNNNNPDPKPKPDDMKSEIEKPNLETPPVNNNGNDGVVSSENLSELVRQELAKADEQKSFSTNVDKVAQRLSDEYGSVQKANEVVNAKAKELGVSVEWLMDAAGKSPTAFFATIGLNGAHSNNTPVSFSERNVRDGGGSKKNYKYFEELRKSNSKAYYSAPVQRELFTARKELGDAFYN